MGKKKETEFDKLARLIKSEGDDIRNTMATKADTATKTDVAGILSELADIKQRLKAVEIAVENHHGFSKEIDHAFARIAV